MTLCCWKMTTRSVQCIQVIPNAAACLETRAGERWWRVKKRIYHCGRQRSQFGSKLTLHEHTHTQGQSGQLRPSYNMQREGRKVGLYLCTRCPNAICSAYPSVACSRSPTLQVMQFQAPPLNRSQSLPSALVTPVESKTKKNTEKNLEIPLFLQIPPSAPNSEPGDSEEHYP